MTARDTALGAGSDRPLAPWLIGYGLAYLVASGLDLWTTSLAVGHGAHEGNVFATQAGAYMAQRSWAVTGVGGLVMLGMWSFGLVYAGRVSRRWLEQPMRSFAFFYVNPWSSRAIDRSPLHMAAYAIAFVVLRVAAAGNNLLIMAGAPGPIGAAVRLVGRLTTPVAGFVLAVSVIYIGLAVLLSPIAAGVIARRQKGGAAS